MPGKTTPTTLKTNGVLLMGATTPGSGRVVFVVGGVFDSATLAFGVSIDDGTEEGTFHEFATPAPITATGEVLFDCGANMRYGVSLTSAGASTAITVAASGPY